MLVSVQQTSGEIENKISAIDLPFEKELEVKKLFETVVGIKFKTYCPGEGDVCKIRTRSASIWDAIYAQTAPNEFTWMGVNGDNRIIERDEPVEVLRFICSGLRNYWENYGPK